MENRVFILVFLIAVLSFLFTAVSLIILHIRGKYNLSCSGVIWVILFIATAVPIVNQQSMFQLQLFTDYTGGMRIELQDDGEILRDDIYIPKKAIDVAAGACGLISAVWFITATAYFTYGLAGYFDNLHFLTKHSSECHDERINEIFARAKKKAGLHRNITLRTMNSDIRLSPCTCGIIFPAVYIGSDYLSDYSDLRLELVFLHELIHIKHHDPSLKFLTLIVTSFFKLLPMSARVKNAVGEDVEFRCDKSVLEIMGDGVRGEYIAMIIDVAERNLKDECGNADFLSSVSRSGEMIINRYKYMKERHSRKSSAVYAFPLLVAAITLNMVLMSVFSIKNIDNLGVDLANPLIETAMCEYFGIPDAHELTEDDIASVYSLEFALSDYREMLGDEVSERYAMTCTINEGLVWNGSEYTAPVADDIKLKLRLDIVPELIRSDIFDKVIAPDTPEHIRLRERYTESDGFMILSEYNESELREYILSEYTSGRLSEHFSTSKIVDTRDIVLFTGLRTLIFSDRLKTEDDTIYTAEDYAVISRAE